MRQTAQPPRIRWRRLAPLLVITAATAVVVPLLLIGPAEQNTPVGPVGTGLPTEFVTTGPVATETRTPRPEGRDMGAVTAALRALDPCRLPGVEFARSRGLPDATAIRTGPHSCLLHADAPYSPGDVEKGIEVRVGTHNEHVARYMAAPVTIGGAKAYEEAHERESFSECRVVVPVSPVRAVEFAYEANESADLCPTTRRFAEAAVAKLRDPDSVAMDPAGRPFAAWDGCSLLARVLGADAETFRFEPDGLPDPFAGCYGSPPANSDRHGPRLEISYAAAPEPTGPTRRIAGRAVEVRQNSGSCTAIWDNGPSGGRNRWFATTVVELTVDDCDAIPGMVKRVVSLAGQRPPDSGTAPQRPLLYGPEDNDTATLGACVDFGSGADDDCEPYQPVDVPAGPEAILTAAEVNRHVQCAVFADAVEAGFGPAHTPVTWGAHCFFVDPSHELVISVNVSSGWGTAPGGYGRGDLYRERQVTEVAGLPAVTFWDSRGTTFDVYVSPYGSLSAPGNLHIGLKAQPPRGSGMMTAPLARAQADRAVRVMTRVVETFFT